MNVPAPGLQLQERAGGNKFNVVRMGEEGEDGGHGKAENTDDGTPSFTTSSPPPGQAGPPNYFFFRMTSPRLNIGP